MTIYFQNYTGLGTMPSGSTAKRERITKPSPAQSCNPLADQVCHAVDLLLASYIVLDIDNCYDVLLNPLLFPFVHSFTLLPSQTHPPPADGSATWCCSSSRGLGEVECITTMRSSTSRLCPACMFSIVPVPRIREGLIAKRTATQPTSSSAADLLLPRQ